MIGSLHSKVNSKIVYDILPVRSSDLTFERSTLRNVHAARERLFNLNEFCSLESSTKKKGNFFTFFKVIKNN